MRGRGVLLTAGANASGGGALSLSVMEPVRQELNPLRLGFLQQQWVIPPPQLGSLALQRGARSTALGGDAVAVGRFRHGAWELFSGQHGLCLWHQDHTHEPQLLARRRLAEVMLMQKPPMHLA